MTSKLKEKLEYNKRKLELQIQNLNNEVELKELELTKISREIQRLGTQNSGVLNN